MDKGSSSLERTDAELDGIVLRMIFCSSVVARNQRVSLFRSQGLGAVVVSALVVRYAYTYIYTEISNRIRPTLTTLRRPDQALSREPKQ